MSKHKCSGKPPWEQDGIKIKNLKIKESRGIASQVIKATQICVEEAIANFYILDAIQSGVVAGNIQTLYSPDATTLLINGKFPIRKQNSIEFDATLKFGEVATTLAASFEMYLWHALSTELCYSYMSRDLGCHTNQIHQKLKGISEEFGAVKVAEWVERVFRTPKWEYQYGGKKWANIANVLKLYYQKEINGQLFTSREFCDRVFSLQHNTGTCLNKTSWGSEGNRKPINSNKLKKILDLHAKSDLENLATYADHEVQELYNIAKNQPIKKLVKKTKG